MEPRYCEHVRSAGGPEVVGQLFVEAASQPGGQCDTQVGACTACRAFDGRCHGLAHRCEPSADGIPCVGSDQDNRRYRNPACDGFAAFGRWFVGSRYDVAVSVSESVDRSAGRSRVGGIGKPVGEHVHFEDRVVTFAIHSCGENVEPEARVEVGRRGIGQQLPFDRHDARSFRHAMPPVPDVVGRGVSTPPHPQQGDEYQQAHAQSPPSQ